MRIKTRHLFTLGRLGAEITQEEAGIPPVCLMRERLDGHRSYRLAIRLGAAGKPEWNGYRGRIYEPVWVLMFRWYGKRLPHVASGHEGEAFTSVFS